MEETLPRPYPPKFFDLLNEVFEEEERGRKTYDELRHNPSSASVKINGNVVGACLRNLWYKANKEPESDPKTLSNKLQASFGNSIHDLILSKLQKSDKIKITPESAGRVSVEGLEKVVSFRLDGLVNHKGEYGGLEIKTMQGFGLTKMVKDGGPKEHDLLQVISYFETNELIRWFVLLYIARDTAYRLEYHIWRDPKTNSFMLEDVSHSKEPRPIEGLTFEGIVNRWKELEGYVNSKVIPPRDYKAVLTKDGRLTDKRTKNGVDYKTDWRCQYCSYKTKCWTLPDAKDYAYKIGD